MHPTNFKVVDEIWSWSNPLSDDIVGIPYKVGHSWFEQTARYGNAVDMLKNLYTEDADHYFAPNLFGSSRREESWLRSGVIYADIDAPSWTYPWKDLPLQPTLVIASGSAGHMHFYWRLPHPVADLDLWKGFARGMTEVVPFADPGGWDSTQVLRIPGTVNHKHGEPVRMFSSVGLHRPTPHWDDFPFSKAQVKRTHDPEDLEVEPLSEDARLELVGELWERLDLETRYWLTQRDYGGVSDRSKLVWKIINSLKDTGLSRRETFRLISGAPWDKNRRNPEKLVREINKAWGYES